MLEVEVRGPGNEDNVSGELRESTIQVNDASFVSIHSSSIPHTC
jgi:hypothetical protein